MNETTNVAIDRLPGGAGTLVETLILDNGSPARPECVLDDDVPVATVVH